MHVEVKRAKNSNQTFPATKNLQKNKTTKNNFSSIRILLDYQKKDERKMLNQQEIKYCNSNMIKTHGE